MEFFEELRRRSVLRVAAAYAIAGWLVLQFMDVVFPMLGLDESLGRPVLIVILIGFPIVLLLAWSLEITPSGIKRDADVDHAAGEREFGRRKLDRIIVVVLTAALGLLLAERFLMQPAVDELEIVPLGNEASLAVLPFVNLSGRAEDEYFSDGLTETLLHMLAQSPELKVAARTSVFAFKGKNSDVREIAESLGVANILEGTVQRSGNRVRITAQLIEANHGFHLWSRNFDRDLDDIFVVQDEIATSVSWALRMTLLTDDGGSSAQLTGNDVTDADAYEAYLQGLEQKNLSSYSSLPNAENLLKKALALDPAFVEAQLELAMVYELQRETGLLTTEESEDRIRPLIDQVLAARPQDGRALGLLATLDWRSAVVANGPGSEAAAQAEQALLRALELAPNDPAIYAALSVVSATRNDPEKSLEWTEEGLKVDPLSARLHLQRGQILLFMLDRAEDALASFEEGQELAPGWTAMIFNAGRAEFQLGNFGDGVAWYLRAMDVDPQDHELPSAISRLYYQIGMTEEGDRMYERARAIAPQSPWIRSLELERALRAGLHERAVLIAEGILRDDIENRGNAYVLALTGYASAMTELGRADRVPGFFESLLPGVSAVNFVPADLREFLMRFTLVLTMANERQSDSTDIMLAALVASADATIPGWRDNQGRLMSVALARGDRVGAIDYALSDLGQPLAENLDWSLQYRHTAWIRPLLEDARIAVRSAELDREMRLAAEDVREMLDARQVPAI